MNLFARRLSAALALVLAVMSPVAMAHDEDDGHEHHHHHGPVVQPRNFDHAVDLVRDGLERLGVAVNKGDMHALHELSDGVVVPARAFGKLAAARPGAAPANIRAINTLGQDIATLVDAMHVAADSSKADVVVAKWEQILPLRLQLEVISPSVGLMVALCKEPTAGQPCDVTAVLSHRDNSPVQAAEDHAGHPVHLFIVSSDLGFFAHERPEPRGGTSFTLDFTPPAGGTHCVFALAFPAGRTEPLLVRAPMAVKGAGIPSRPAIKPDAEPSKRIGAYLVRLGWPEHLHARDSATLTYRIDDAENPGGIGTEEFLGAPAHFVGVSADTEHFVSSTKVERGGLGEIRVEATFPHEGLYCTWLEFKHNGKVVTVPFVIEVHQDH